VGGKDRHKRPTTPLTPAQLSKLAKQPVPLEDDAALEWDDDSAVGTPPHSSLPPVSRTSTRHDPLTTEILAEITRTEDPDPDPPSTPHTIRRTTR
jgi:hypothetical protein